MKKNSDRKLRYLIYINKSHNSAIFARSLLLSFNSKLYEGNNIDQTKNFILYLKIILKLLKKNELKELILMILRIRSRINNISIINEAITNGSVVYVHDINSVYFSTLEDIFGKVFVLIKNGTNCTEKESSIRKIYPYKSQRYPKAHYLNGNPLPVYSELSKVAYIHGYKKGAVFGYSIINLAKDLATIGSLKKEFPKLVVIPHPSANFLKYFYKNELSEIKSASLIITNSKSIIDMLNKSLEWVGKFRIIE